MAITLPLKAKLQPSGLLLLFVPYLVHVVVISRIRSQSGACMTVVAPLFVVLQGQLVKQGTGSRVGTGKEMGDWTEAETRWFAVSRDPVYKCCKR